MSAPEHLFGFSEFTTWPWSYRTDVRKYKEHGADVIEICEFKLAQGEFDSLSFVGEQGLRPSSVQMKVHSVFVDSMANKPEDPSDRIDEMKKTMAGSAPFLPPGTPFVVITGIAPEKNFRKAAECTIEALKELGDAAARCRMRIAFEPLNPVNIHTDTAVWGLDQGLEVVDAVNDPNVGICIDSWNVWQTPSLNDVIRQCGGSRIFLVQLSDWLTPRSTADRYSLGDGEIPLADMFRSIRETGYSGPWVIEILSSMHLKGSLWKGDLDELLRKNCIAFERLWSASVPQPSMNS